MGEIYLPILILGILGAAFVNAQVSGDITTNSGLWLAAGLVCGMERRHGAGAMRGGAPAWR